MVAAAGLMPAPSIARRSLDGDAAGLDRAAPARDFARDELLEILRRAAVRRRDLLAERLETPTQRWQVKRLAHRLAELGDNRRRCVFGEEQALPGQHVEIEALL